MKKRILFVVIAALFVGGLYAQEETGKKEKKKSKVGSFLRKMGEQSTGINMTNEPFIVNPLSADFDVEFVGLYGNTSGDVTLVFRIRNKKDQLFKVSSDSNGNNRTIAFDARGKSYPKCQYYSVDFTAPKGIWTEIKLEGRDGFCDVPVGLESFELINVYCLLNNSVATSGLVEFRNMPIQWGVDPE